MASKTRSRSDDTFVVAQELSVASSSSSTLEEDGDAPSVFLCGKCRQPVGDSLSWAGSDEDLNQILLSRVSDNIVIEKEPYVSRVSQELGCLVVDLNCSGCGSTLGLMYTSTPKKLDFKRSLFCFNVANIESYVLGSAGQQMAAVGSEDKPVTLEFQEIIEQQMLKIKSLAVTIGQRLFEIELDVQNKSESDMSCS